MARRSVRGVFACRRRASLYRELLELARDRSVTLEEYARQMIQAEEVRAGDVDKMLRKPGDVARFRG